MGLRLKLGFAVVLFISAAQGVVGYLQITAERDLLLTERQRRGTTLLRSFSIPCAIAMANNDTPTLDNYVDQFATWSKEMDLAYMAVLNFDGDVVAHTREGEFGKRYRDPLTREAMVAESSVVRVTGEGREAILEIAVPVVSGLRWGTVRAGFTLHRMEMQLLERQQRAILTAIGVSLGVAALAYLVLSFLVIRPLFRMSDMANRFGSGRLEARVELEQRDEMGELAGQLNSMAQQIQRYTGSLEKLVDERTTALADANERLVTANTQLERLARTDALTGLYNRRHFMEQLHFEIRRAQRTPNPFAILMMDVDHFKNFNDTNGHTAGDELLQRLSALLEINLRGTDVIARYGGEEFIILLLDTAPDEGYATAVKLQRAVETQPMPHEHNQPGGRLTVSIGVSYYPHDAVDAPSLIDSADRALYASKAAGRNRATRYRDVDQGHGTGDVSDSAES